ncbi:BTB/POZ domain-containing protein [Tanacetum coccineum]
MLDMIPNGVFRAELEVESIINKMREGRLRWFSHVKRRPQIAPVRKVKALTVDGLRRKGRKLRWEDRLKQDMKEILSSDMTSDTNAWRDRISIGGICWKAEIANGLTECGQSVRWIFRDVPSDITIEVNGVTFALHKFPLVSRCSRIRKLVSDHRDNAISKVELLSLPGGVETFEQAAKFCYGINFEISSSNSAINIYMFTTSRST